MYMHHTDTWCPICLTELPLCMCMLYTCERRNSTDCVSLCSRYYDNRKQAARKEQKTLDASGKVFCSSDCNLATSNCIVLGLVLL